MEQDLFYTVSAASIIKSRITSPAWTTETPFSVKTRESLSAKFLSKVSLSALKVSPPVYSVGRDFAEMFVLYSRFRNFIHWVNSARFQFYSS